MIYSDETRRSKNFHPSDGNAQWQDTVNLLKLMQNDYQGARKQLEQINLKLAEREALVNQHLQHAFLSSQGYQTLCLSSYESNTPFNSMGNIVLGEIVRPAAVPSLTRIEINCLGRFEVHSAFSHIENWHSVKAKSVFQYLLLKPREPTVKDTLMEALWPDCTPQAASNNLKSAIHNLRLILNELLADTQNQKYILFQQGSYLINPDIDLWIDIEEFEKCWTAGHRLEKKGEISQAIPEFEKAESLYRGDYLENECYEDWTLLRREALKDTYLIVLSRLADHSMHVGDYESGISYSQKILAKDHCREDTYRRLMYCHTKLGQRNRALRWYEICRQTNKAELDATPDNATLEMYYKILKDEDF